MKLRKKISALLVSVMLALTFSYSIPSYAVTRVAEVNFAYTEIKGGDSIESTASKFTALEPEKYEIKEFKVKDYVNYNVWINSGEYIDGHTYTIDIKVEPKNGYKFVLDFDAQSDEHSYINVDGYRITGTQSISEDWVEFEYHITVGSKEVKEVNLIFNEPVVGKKPEFVVSTYTTVPEGAFKGDIGLYWEVGSDYGMSDARVMNENDVFEEGKYYTAQVYYGELFEIRTGYFAGNTCTKVNGIIREDRPFFYTPEDVHKLTKVPAKTATCMSDGNIEYYTCSICGKCFSDDTARTEIAKDSWVVKAPGHKWDGGKVTKEATTKEAGVKTYTCTVCEETKTEVIDKLPETPAKEEPKEGEPKEEEPKAEEPKAEEPKAEEPKAEEPKVEKPKTEIPDGYFATYEGVYFYKDSNGDITCIDAKGKAVINEFKCDGTYTYYFQFDGTAMKDRLTYHPDGTHVIYFDSEGHEVFSDFANVKRTIAGDEVDDYCFFNVFGYMYVDVVTYDKSGTVLYYANAYGVMEMGKWFQFSDNVTWADGREGDEFKGGYGCANEDGTLMTNTRTTDWEGRPCYMQGNGVALY